MVLRNGTGMNRDMKGLGFEAHHRTVGFISILCLHNYCCKLQHSCINAISF